MNIELLQFYYSDGRGEGSIMKERPAKRRRAPPPLRYAVQGFAPLRRRLGVTAMANRV